MYEQPFNPFAKNLAIVKDYFKSSSVLIFAILKSVAVVLTIPMSILSTIVAPYFILSAKYSMENSLSGVPASDAQSIRDMMDPFWQFIQSSIQSSASPLQTVVNNLPSISVAALVAVALFLIYFKSKNENAASSPKAGVVILYVLAVIELVCVWIAVVAVALVVIFLFWLYAALQGSTGSISSIEAPMFLSDPIVLPFTIEVEAIRIIVLVLAITVTVSLVIGAFFSLFTAINKKRFYRSIKQSITTVELQSKGARPYGVMCIFGAVFSGIGLTNLVSNFTLLFSVPANGAYITYIILSSLIQIAAFVALIFEAKIALGYKKYIDDKKYGYSRPVAPSAPYSPFPYSQGGSAPQNPYTAAPSRQAPNAPAAAPSSAPAAVPAEKPSAPAAPTASTCPRCGTAVDKNAPFCGNCGNKL